MSKMNDDIEKRKKELQIKLESELYVDRYDTFKQSVLLINKALIYFNIEFEYTYDVFCADFTEECLKYMDDHPDIDMMDPNEMITSVFPIVMSMIKNVKNKYPND